MAARSANVDQAIIDSAAHRLRELETNLYKKRRAMRRKQSTAGMSIGLSKDWGITFKPTTEAKESTDGGPALPANLKSKRRQSTGSALVPVSNPSSPLPPADGGDVLQACVPQANQDSHCVRLLKRAKTTGRMFSSPDESDNETPITSLTGWQSTSPRSTVNNSPCLNMLDGLQPPGAASETDGLRPAPLPLPNVTFSFEETTTAAGGPAEQQGEGTSASGKGDSDGARDRKVSTSAKIVEKMVDMAVTIVIHVHSGFVCVYPTANARCVYPTANERCVYSTTNERCVDPTTNERCVYSTASARCVYPTANARCVHPTANARCACSLISRSELSDVHHCQYDEHAVCESLVFQSLDDGWDIVHIMMTRGFNLPSV